MFNPQGYKAECNGNDFIIIMKDHCPETFNDEKIKELCDRDSGIGADGLLLIDLDVDSYDFKMDYYNNDGSWETMCANGALCVIQVLQDTGYQFHHHAFLAGDGEHQLNIKDGMISIRMKSPLFKTEDVQVAGCIGAHVDSGAKHFVTISAINKIDELYTIAQSIRYDDYFSPTGLNVNFLKINSPDSIHVITYEKGIEAMMRSCGSGSVAAAFYASKHSDIVSPLTITNPGGKMQLIFNADWSEVWLTSNPTIEFEIKS